MCVCVEPCMAEHTVQYCGGWLAGAAAGKRLQRRLRLGSAIAPSYRFPHEGLPYHPCPERSPFFSHPRDTRLPLSLSFSTHPLPPFSTSSSSLTPRPPSPPFISTQLSVVQHSTAGVGVGASKILSQKNTHINTHTETP